MNDNEYKIAGVTIENFMKLKFVSIRFDESGIVLGGENGAGKTSIAQALITAFGGKRAVPADPVRHGADEAKIVIELDRDLIIEATVQPDRSYSVELKDKEGGVHRRAQERLDAFNAEYSFWPQRFIEQPEKEQVDLLLRLVGLDLEALERKRTAIYQERTEKNRELNRAIASIPPGDFYEGVPTEELSSSELLEMISAANEVVTNISAKKRDAEQLRKENAIRLKQMIRWQEELDALKAKMKETEQTIERVADEAGVLELDIEQAALPDIEALKNDLRELETVNRKIRENTARLKAEHQVASVEFELEGLNAKIREIDDEKEKQVREAKFPVDGLGFNDNGVTLDGVPFKQASDAQQWTAAIAVGMAMKPKLKLVYVKNGGALTATTRKKLYELARAKEFQLLFELPGDAADVGVLMEDGEVKEDRRPNGRVVTGYIAPIKASELLGLGVSTETDA